MFNFIQATSDPPRKFNSHVFTSVLEKNTIHSEVKIVFLRTLLHMPICDKHRKTIISGIPTKLKDVACEIATIRTCSRFELANKIYYSNKIENKLHNDVRLQKLTDYTCASGPITARLCFTRLCMTNYLHISYTIVAAR